MKDALYQALIHGDSVVAWLGAAVAALIIKYLIAKIGNDKIRLYAERAAREVFNAVEEVWMTYVKALKEGNLDGRLTPEEKAEAKTRAISIAKSNIGAKGITRLAKVLGVGELDTWLGTKVESSVNALKMVGRSAKSAPRPAPLP